MLRFLIRRLLSGVLVVWMISVFTFGLFFVAPNNVARLLCGRLCTPVQLNLITKQLGLNDPILVQYWHFLDRLLHGDLGRSFATHLSVSAELGRTWPATFELSVAAMAIALVVGLPLGVTTAVRRGGLYDQAARVIVLVTVSMPIFWSGLLLIYYFAVGLGWLPTSGRGSGDVTSELSHLVLPAVSLSTFSLAVIMRLTRSSMLDVLGEDYMRTARGKRLTRRVLYLRHALPNMVTGSLTIAGNLLPALIAGTVLVENVFAWPGLGTAIADSVIQQDYAVVQAIVLVLATTVLAVNFVIDVGLALLDPLSTVRES